MSARSRDPNPQWERTVADDRLAHGGRRDRGSVGIRAVEQEPIDTVGKARRERDRRATAGGAADQRDRVQRELVEHRGQQGDVAVEREVLVAHLAIRHADAEPVVAHQRVPLGDGLPQRPERRIVPVELQVTDPPRRRDERRTVAGDRVRDATTGEGQESDLGFLPHAELYGPSTATPRGSPRSGSGGEVERHRTGDAVSSARTSRSASRIRNVCTRASSVRRNASCSNPVIVSIDTSGAGLHALRHDRERARQVVAPAVSGVVMVHRTSLVALLLPRRSGEG